MVAGISIVGLVALGLWTYSGAPPLADFESSSTGERVIPLSLINRGQEVFHLKGLMSYGSFWGDGAERGPDFTADALHRTVVSMRSFYEDEVKGRQGRVTQYDKDAIAARVQREAHTNGYDEKTGVIRINDAQIHAYRELNDHYTRMFTDPTYEEAFNRAGLITDPEDLKALTAYCFWGGWVSAADRPGAIYSYTHNWPYDPEAGNTPTQATVIWSVVSILALFAGTMLVLYVYGEMKTLPGDPFNKSNGGMTLTTIDLEKGGEFVRPTQRLTYKFFAFAVVLFLVQVLAGILSAENFVGGGPGTAMLRCLRKLT